MVAMCTASYFYFPATSVAGNAGICLPSPNLWHIKPVSSWIINVVVIGGIAAGGFFMNRNYNFIRSTEPVLPAMFMVLVASCPWITRYLSSSTLLCAINLISLSVIFSAYNSRNATQQLFTIGTLLSVGSMFQYAFIPMVPIYLVAAIMMKVLRIKEFLAYGMGLIAPYWVGVGLGLIGLDQFRLPEITGMFTDMNFSPTLFVLVVSIGLAVFCGLLLGLNNSIKLYAGNSRVNAMNGCISLLGVMCVVCMLIDFTNMMAYLATLYFAVAVQVANLCALWNIRREWLVVFIPSLIYIGFFVAIMLMSL